MLNPVHDMLWLGARAVRGLISLENSLITNLYLPGGCRPQSRIKNVFLRPKRAAFGIQVSLRNFIL